MVNIVFKAAYGDHDKEVHLTNHHGGGGSYHIYLDRRYCGMITLQQDDWCIHLSPKSDEEFTTEDRAILIDIIRDSI